MSCLEFASLRRLLAMQCLQAVRSTVQATMRIGALPVVALVVACGITLGVAQNASAQVLQFPQGEFPRTNFQKSSVDIEEIFSGGPPRDGIPAIDKPVFVTVDEAGQWLMDQEPVIVLSVSDQTKIYPLQIMMFHEIVNDTIAGTPVAVTFCPLCNASIVFDRTLGVDDTQQVLDFGTTGRLRKSDLVMYDRQTETWWQQFTGIGIIGDYTDIRLEQLPSQIASFDQARQYFPDAQVLSTETGYQRQYGSNPYRGYDAIDNNPFLFKGDLDPRLPAMERVLSIRTDGATHLVPVTPLNDVPVVNLQISDNPVVVFAASTAASALDAGRIAESRAIPAAAAFAAVVGNDALTFSLREDIIVDQQTGTQWNGFGLGIKGEHQGVQLKQVDAGVHFAFAWLAFDPNAVVEQID